VTATMLVRRPTAPASAGSRFGWGIVDTALSSIGNFGLAAVIARSASTSEFGAFSVAFALYSLALGIGRGFYAQPLLVRLSTQDVASRIRARGAALACSVTIAIAGSLVLLSASLAVPPPLRAFMAALALGLPALLLQDAWRYFEFADRNPRRAALCDGGWVLGQAGAFGILLGTHRASPTSLFAAWAITSLIGLLAVARGGLRLHFRGVRRWFADHGRLSRDLSFEFVGQATGTHLVPLVLAALFGLDVTGALRGAQLLFAPVIALIGAAAYVGVPEAAALRRNPARLFHSCLRAGALMAVPVAVTVLVAVLLPASWGRSVLGSQWHSALVLLAPVALSTAALALCTACLVGLRALTETRHTLPVRLALGAATLSAALVGGWIAASLGAAWGIALANVTGAAAVVVVLGLTARAHEES
jgi:O-antigen/teichoic acid export membrane protein